MLDYVIIIQARLSSTRFPEKILHPIAGKRVLSHIIDACKDTGIETVLAVPSSDLETLDTLFPNVAKFATFTVEEDDVLGRIFSCAQDRRAKNIVRITSDCVCLTSSMIKAVIDEHREYPDKFVSNVRYDVPYLATTNVPDGYDVEVFSFDILRQAYLNAQGRDREHATAWMRVNCPVRIAELALVLQGKFSLDTKQDLERIERNFDLLKSAKVVKIKS